MSLIEPAAGLAGGDGAAVVRAFAPPAPVPKPLPAPGAPPLPAPGMPSGPIPVPPPVEPEDDDPAATAQARPEVAALAPEPARRSEFLARRFAVQDGMAGAPPRVFTRRESARLARALNETSERRAALDQLAELTREVPAARVAVELREAGLAPGLGAAVVLARDPAQARHAEALLAHAGAQPDATARAAFRDVFAASPQGRALGALVASAPEEQREDWAALRAALLESGARCTAGLAASHGAESAARHAQAQCIAPARDAFAATFGLDPAALAAATPVGTVPGPVPPADPDIAGTEIPASVIARADGTAAQLRSEATALAERARGDAPDHLRVEADAVRDLIDGEGMPAARKAAIRERLALSGPDARPGVADPGRQFLYREAVGLIDRLAAGKLTPEAARAAFDAALQEVRDNHAAVATIGDIILDFVPFVGDAKGLHEAAVALDEAWELLRRGHYTAAGVALSGVAAGVIGLIPVAGDAARFAIGRLREIAGRRRAMPADEAGELAVSPAMRGEGRGAEASGRPGEPERPREPTPVGAGPDLGASGPDDPVFIMREWSDAGYSLDHARIEGLRWNRGIREQGVPWEDHIESRGEFGERAPPTYPVIDFFDRDKGVVISAKTMYIATKSRIRKPDNVFRALKIHVDKLAAFDGSGRRDFIVRKGDASSKVLALAIPRGGTIEQFREIRRAVDYARDLGIDVRVTVVDGS